MSELKQDKISLEKKLKASEEGCAELRREYNAQARSLVNITKNRPYSMMFSGAHGGSTKESMYYIADDCVSPIPSSKIPPTVPPRNEVNEEKKISDGQKSDKE